MTGRDAKGGGMKQRSFRRPFPPYGRQVFDRLGGDRRSYNGTSPDGNRAQLMIAVGTEAMGWPPRHQHNLAVAVPAGEDPSMFRWDWAARHAPAVIVRSGNASVEEIESIAAALLRDGAGLVVAALENGWTRYEPERRAA